MVCHVLSVYLGTKRTSAGFDSIPIVAEDGSSIALHVQVPIFALVYFLFFFFEEERTCVQATGCKESRAAAPSGRCEHRREGETHAGRQRHDRVDVVVRGRHFIDGEHKRGILFFIHVWCLGDIHAGQLRLCVKRASDAFEGVDAQSCEQPNLLRCAWPQTLHFASAF